MFCGGTRSHASASLSRWNFPSVRFELWVCTLKARWWGADWWWLCSQGRTATRYSGSTWYSQYPHERKWKSFQEHGFKTGLLSLSMQSEPLSPSPHSFAWLLFPHSALICLHLSFCVVFMLTFLTRFIAVCFLFCVRMCSKALCPPFFLSFSFIYLFKKKFCCWS